MSEPPLILVVEDNLTNQLLATTVLARDGFETMVADSPDEALVCIRSRRPDLILMDVQLPGMDGLTLTRHLQSLPEAAGIPVVAVTSHAMVGDREKAMDAGCVGYMTKPIDTRTLGQDVRGFLRGASATAA